MNSEPDRIFENSLKWYLPIISAYLIVAFTSYFPLGQTRWMFFVRTAVVAIWIVATIAYAAVCIRVVRLRKKSE